MKTALLFGFVLLLGATTQVAAAPPASGGIAAPQSLADGIPTTLMTVTGKLLLVEDYLAPLPPPVGSVARFASGFKGWRFNVERRGGHWDLVDGTFRGIENADHRHPATASIGFDFKDVVISCQVRLHDVPLAGRNSRRFSIRTTDTKDYVCTIMLDPSGMRIQKDDNDHRGPDVAVPLAQRKKPIPLDEWQTVVFEILDDEMVGSLNGQSLTGGHPLIASNKKSIMFVSNGEGSVRNLRVWEAFPNSDWAKHKAVLLEDQGSAVAR